MQVCECSANPLTATKWPDFNSRLFYNIKIIQARIIKMDGKAVTLKQTMITQNRQKIIQLLSEPDVSTLLKAQDQVKHTPLFWACQNLSENLALEIIPKLLEKGADPYKLDKYGEDVLYYLAKLGKDKILKYLLDRYKYNLNANDENKQTALFFAAAYNQMKCAQILVDKGTDVNHIDKNGQNCLFYAAGFLEMCKFLVNSGVNFQRVDFLKQTALYYAKLKKEPSCIAYLSDLKQNMKSRKDMIKMQSSQQESNKGNRKKKELTKQQYCLIYTNEKGEVHELTAHELQQFGAANDNNRRVLDLIYRPQKLESHPVPEERRYEKIANKILTHFMKHEQGSIFLYPVDPVALNIPHYPNIVKHPMDFTTIRTKLSYNAYDSQVDFNADMNLIFDNCILFNGRESSYGKIATQMRLEFNTMYKKQFGI